MALKVKKPQAIRRGSTVPAYHQLADILRQRIADLPADQRTSPLPSEGDLARQYNLSRITVRQALKNLEAKGLVYSMQGKGSFPTVPRVPGISGFHSFTAEVTTLPASVPESSMVKLCRSADGLMSAGRRRSLCCRSSTHTSVRSPYRP